MNKELIEKLKNKLQEEKNEAEADLKSFAHKDPNLKGNWDANRPKEENPDMEERADETEEYDARISVEQSLEVKLKNINLALEKIEKEAYGRCENCEKEISEERLMAYPEARLCMECNKS